jgi:SlyX protein
MSPDMQISFGGSRTTLYHRPANPPEETMQQLEEKLAHLIRTVDDLSDVLARQQTEIATLTRRVKMLMDREANREAQGGGGIVLGNERPPHY